MTRQPDDMAAQAVLSRLGRGSDAAVSKAALADQLGWTEREVKRAVRDLRLDGWLVLSGNDGYWLGDSRDVEGWLRRQRSQILSMLHTYKRVRETANRQRNAELKQMDMGLVA